MRLQERRINPSTTQFRVAPAQNGSSIGTIHGYAAVFSNPGQDYGISADLGGFRERCAKGCFADSLRRDDDVRALVNHDPSLVIGRSTNGTLRLREDQTGLRMEVDLPDTSTGRDLLASVRRGDLSQCSFAFNVEEDDWDEERFGEDSVLTMVRTLKAVRLQDCSVVAFPAYDATSVSDAGRMSPELIMGRGLTFDQMFPQGVPMEVRSRVPNVRAAQQRSQDARRRLTNFVLGL